MLETKFSGHNKIGGAQKVWGELPLNVPWLWACLAITEGYKAKLHARCCS